MRHLPRALSFFSNKPSTLFATPTPSLRRSFNMSSQDDFKNDILEAVRPALESSLADLYGQNPSKALNLLGKQLESKSLNQGAEPQLKLYGAANLCPNTWRVDSYLNHFKIPFTPVKVDILNGEQKKPEFLKLNAQGFVPVLVDEANGVTVIESGALLLYLDNVWGNSAGKPSDPKELAKMYELLYRVIGNLRNFESMYVVHGADLDEQKLHNLLGEFKFLEQEIGDKQFLASSQAPSLVDFLVLPNVFVSKISGLDLEARYPKLDAWVERMLALPGVRDGNVMIGWRDAIKEKQGLEWEERRNPYKSLL